LIDNTLKKVKINNSKPLMAIDVCVNFRKSIVSLIKTGDSNSSLFLYFGPALRTEIYSYEIGNLAD